MPRRITSWLFALFCFVSFAANGQLTAHFTADDTAGCEPMLVHFTNTSTGATSYTWNLGNGSPPTSVVDASGSYLTAGTYTITLTARNGSATNVYSSTIRVYPKPTVNFSAVDTAVCPGRPITFISTSTSGAWGPLSYTWNFGDGGSSSATSPAYPFTTPGYYSITLYARSAPGCTNSATRSSYIHIYTSPTAGFYTARTSFCTPPATIPFTNVSTGTGALSYVWRFGDGTTSFGTGPTHVYTTSGSYTVTLKATDSHGCVDSMVMPDYIQAGALTADFTLGSSACINAPTTFTNTSSTHIASTWSFGDGSATSTDETGVHTYTATGTYNVKLIVFDGACFDTVIHPVTVAPAPTISYSVSPAHPCSPPVNLTFSATAPAGSTVTWYRYNVTTVADSLTGAVATFNFPLAQMRPMQLKVTSAIGCVSTIDWIDTVYNLRVGEYKDPKQGCIPLPVHFEANVYSLVYDLVTGAIDPVSLPYPRPITGYRWTFGDGSPPSILPTPDHTYTVAGIFPDTVTVTDVYGCFLKYGEAPLKAGTPPIASFTRTPTHACGNQIFTFRSTSPLPANGWAWHLGDDTGGEDSVLRHKFLKPGIFRDSLYAFYNGCKSLLPAVSIDTIDSPVAALSYRFDCAPWNQISFSNLSIGADSYLWQFGDGTSTSTIMNPVHAYSAAANFNVMLTTYNPRNGCRDTARMLAKMQRLTAIISQSDSTICKGQSSAFQAVVYIHDTDIRRGTGANDTTRPMRFQWYIDGVLIDSTFSPPYGTDTFSRPFYTGGLHTVTLRTTNNHGCFDTFVRHVLVGDPHASFTYPTPTGCAPLIVDFSDHSTDVSGVTITTHAWSYGDGDMDTTTASSISHGFTFSGTYVMKEVVIDNIGCADSTTSSARFTIYRPTAGLFIGSPNVCVNSSLHFANTSALATSYLWMFGDGATSTVASPNHTYTVAGYYTIRLVAYDSHGCTDTLTRPSYVHVNPIPVPTFYMDDSFSVCPPLRVNFTNTTVGPATYTWLLGDGSTSYATSPSDIYTAPGLYTVKLVATNLYGCRDTGIGHVNIFGYAGAFAYTPLSGCSPLPVRFRATLSHVASMVWDFSDGIISSTSLSDTITHRYMAPGAYLPKLVLTDSRSGCTAVSLGADTIRIDSVSSSFTATPTGGCVGTPISFRDTSFSLLSTITSRLWTFTSGATATGTAPTYTYSVAGTYPVTLSARSGRGCTVTTTQTVTITPLPAPITGTRSFCAGLSSTLSNTTSGGVWSSSDLSVATIGSTSGIVNGITGGTAIITYTLVSGCAITTTVTILRAPGAITGPTGVCVGSTMTLSDTTAGGTWNSSATGVASVGLTTGIVTGVGSGTAVITYSTGGTCIVTKSVIVNTIPLPITGASPLCIGYTTPYTDPITGGSWFSSNTAVASIGSSTGIVTGTGTGTATISYMLGTSCLITKTVNVIPLPSAISGASNVCPGSTTTLTDATTGGTWSSSNPSIATIGLFTGVVTGVSAGVDTITYSPAGCSVTRTFTVDPLPDTISGATRVCIGFTTTLTSASPGGTWSTSGSAAIATIGSSTGVVSGISAGTIIVTYTLPTGCKTTTTVTVASSLPPITGIAHVCEGRTTLLSCSAGGGTWGTSNPSIATVSGGLVTGVSAGTATISYVVSGCPVATTVTVNPLPDPIAGSANVCYGLTTVLTDASPGGRWSSSNPLIAAVGSGGTVTGIAAGSVNITYTLPTGCIAVQPFTVMPAPPPITGITRICAGYTTTLSDAATGGTWSSSASGIALINPTTGVAAGLSAGIATITYVHTGCPTMTTVTVNPLPDPIEGSPIACIGLTTILTDSSTGGLWLSSDPTVATVGATTGIVTAVTAGSAMISYRLPTGCIAAISVTSHPLPPLITGPSGICAGRTVTFTDSASGGTWSSSDTSIASIGLASGIATGMGGGVATISYTIDGCPRTTPVTVNRLPAPITGAATICELTTINVHDADSAIGMWSSTLVTITTGGLVSGVAAGTGILTFTLSTGCYTTTTLNVLPTARPISGSNSVCTGMTITLTDASAGGTWSCGTAAIATIGSTGIVSGISPGAAAITYTLPNGCMRTKTVVVFPPPSAISGITNLCPGDTAILSDSVAGGVWTSANPAIGSIAPSTGTLYGLTTGSTHITYTLAPGCFATIPAMIAPLPVPYTVTGGGNYCAGGAGVSIGLSNSELGVNYTLYRGSATVTTVAGTGTAIDFGLQTIVGTYTVAGTNAALGCRNNMSDSVIVGILTSVTPSVTITKNTADNICGGTLATFAVNAVNGGTAPTYQWSVNGTNAGTDSTDYSYYPADNDVVKVVMTSNAPCANPPVVSSNTITMSVTTPVTPSLSIAIDPDDTVCQGTPVTFNASSVYGGTSNVPAWMVNSMLVGTGPSYSYVPSNGDIIYCTLISNYPCRTADSITSPSITMTVDAPIVPDVTIAAHPGSTITEGQSDTLTATVDKAGANPAYQWYINGILVNGANGGMLARDNFADKDSVSCVVTGSDWCSTTGNNYIIIRVNKSVDSNDDLILFPNPNNGDFTIKGSLGVKTDEEVTLRMFDMLGRELFHKTITAHKGRMNEQFQLDRSIASAIYLLDLRSSSKNRIFHITLVR